MKKIMATITGLAVLSVTLFSGAGCKRVDGGTEAVKLLLANERLNENLLTQELDFFENDIAANAALSQTQTENNAVSPLSAKPLGTNAVSPVDYGRSQTSAYSEWTEFPAYSGTYNQFESFIENIELDATRTAEAIGKMKKKVGVTDKWVKGVSAEYLYMLQVQESAETLYVKDKDGGNSYRVEKRYTRADAKNVYESYDYYEYDDGTTGKGRSLYVPGERYESMFDHSTDFKDYVIVENSRGYWTLMRFGYNETYNEYSFDVCVLKDGIGYNTFVQFDDSTDAPSVAWHTVFDPQTGREYFRVSKWWRTWHFDVALCAFADGFNGLRTYGHLEDDREVHDYDGFVMMTDGGEIAAGEKENGVTFENATLRFNGQEEFYHGSVKLLVETAEDTTAKEAVEKLFSYFNAKGISLYSDAETLAKGIRLSEMLGEEFGTTYEWNGYKLDSVENCASARAELLDFYQEQEQAYVAVKDYETVSARQRLSRNVDFAEIDELVNGENSYANGKILLGQTTVTLSDTKLLEAGTEYELKIGLSLVDENGNLQSVNTVSLAGGNGEKTAYSGDGSFTLAQSGEFNVPLNLDEGKYALVAYVATAADDLRVSEMKPITFVSVANGEVESNAMKIEVAKNTDDTLSVSYTIKNMRKVDLDETQTYTSEQIEKILLREVLAYGYPIDGASVEEVDGKYRLQCYLPTSDGLAQAYVYCELPQTN